MACLVDVTGCWWRRFLHCTHGAVSHIRVLAPVDTNSGRLLNFQEFCELIVRSTTLWSWLCSSPVMVQIGVYPACLIPLFPLASCYIFIFHNRRISLGFEEHMDFLLSSDYRVLLVFNERDSEDLKGTGFIWKLFCLIKIEVRKKFYILFGVTKFFT